MTKPQLQTLINKIRNEIKNKGNTRARIADTFDKTVDFVDSKFIKNEKESLTKLGIPTLVGNVATIRYTNETGLEQTVSLDLSTIVTKDTHITEVNYNASTNTLSLKDNEGNVYQVDLGEFSVYSTTNPGGVTTLTQKGIVKATLSKVGQSGQYADLLEAPDLITSSIENDSSVPGETLNETLEYLHSEVNTPQHDTIVSTEPPTGIANEGTEWIIYK